MRGRRDQRSSELGPGLGVGRFEGSAEGTVKAHSAAVYRKAGVTGRMQLVTLFLDELMEGPLDEHQ